MSNIHSIAEITRPVSQSTQHVRPTEARPAAPWDANTKGLIMSKKSGWDESALPPIGYIYEHWLTVKAAAEIMRVNESNVRYLCIEERIRAVKVGSERRGEWRIDPDSARRYIRNKPSGNPDDDP
jgi:excisionase family DNA binding protein